MSKVRIIMGKNIDQTDIPIDEDILQFESASDLWKAEPAAASVVEYKVGSFTKKTDGTGTQEITGIGFTPKALILFSAQTVSTEDTIAVDLEQCIGFSDGTTEKCIWTGSEDGVGTSDADRIGVSAKILNIRNINSGTSGALLAECDLDSFDADGFTLDWTTNNATAFHIKFIAIGGDNITGVDVGSFVGKTSTGTQNVPTSLNTADFVMLLAPNLVSEDSLTTGNAITIGMATSGTDEGLTSVTSQNGVTTTDTSRYQRINNIITSRSTGNGAVADEASFDGFTSSGFDLDWTTASGTARTYYFITIKGGQWEVGNDTTKTTTGTQAYTTAFQPKGLFLFSMNNVPDTGVQSNAIMTIGASDGTDDVDISLVDVNGLSVTSDSARLSSSSDCYVAVNNTSSTLIEASLSTGGGFNATDFTLNFTKTNAAARQFIWFVVGDE